MLGFCARIPCPVAIGQAMNNRYSPLDHRQPLNQCMLCGEPGNEHKNAGDHCRSLALARVVRPMDIKIPAWNLGEYSCGFGDISGLFSTHCYLNQPNNASPTWTWSKIIRGLAPLTLLKQWLYIKCRVFMPVRIPLHFFIASQ